MTSHIKRRTIHSGAVAAIFLLALLNDVCLGQQRGRSRAGVGLAVAAGAASGGQLVDFDCPEEFGYYPHPSDCTQYYVCVFGGALLESCTGGLMYSHELQTCDWPRNVGCGAEESATISTVRVTDPRTRQTTASGASQRTAPISRGQQQREQQQRQQQDEIAKHQLYADDLGPAEEVETDRQQRVYRGQPSTVGQVARDRDGLRHQVTNAIPAAPGRVASGDKVSVISFGTGLQQQQQQAQQYSFDELILDKNSLLTNETLHHGSRKKRQVRYRFQGQSGPLFQLIHSGLNEFSSVTVPLSNNEANYNNYQNLQPGNVNNNLPIPIPTPVLRPSNPSPPPSLDNDFRPIVNPGVPNKDIRNFQSQENYHTSGQRPPPNLPYTKANSNFKYRPPQIQDPFTSLDSLRQILPQPPSSSKPNAEFSTANSNGPRSYTNFQQNTGVVILPNGPSGTPQSFFNQQVLHNQRETSPLRSHSSSNENRFISRGPNTHNDNSPPQEENYSYLLIQKPNEDAKTFLTRTTENPFYSTSQQQQPSTPMLPFVTRSQTFPAGTGILQFSRDALSLDEVHKHEQRATGHQYPANPSTPSPATPSHYSSQGVRQTWQKLLREQQQSENWSPSSTRATTAASESASSIHNAFQINADTEQKQFANQQFSEQNNRVSPTQTQNDHPFKPNVHPYGDNHNLNSHKQEPGNEFVVVSRDPNLQNKGEYTNNEQFPKESYATPLNVQQIQQPFLYNENNRYVIKAEPDHYIKTVQNSDDSRSQLYKDLNQATTKSESASVPVEEYESVKLPTTQDVNRFVKLQQPSQQYDDYEDYEEDDELEEHYSYRGRPYYDEENSEEENKTFRSSQNTRTQKLPSYSVSGRLQVSTLKYKNQKEGSNNDQYTQEQTNNRKHPLQSQIAQVSAEEEYDEAGYKKLSLEDRDRRTQSTTIRSIPVETSTENHLPPQEIPENVNRYNIHNTFVNSNFDLEDFIDQITGEPKSVKGTETVTFTENGEPQTAVENANHRQPKKYVKSTTPHTESSTPVPATISPKTVRTRYRTRLPIHIDLSQRRRPTTRTTSAPKVATVVPTATTRLKQTTENLRDYYASQNLRSEGIRTSLPEAQPTASLSYTNYHSYSKDDMITTSTIKTTSFSPVPIVITNHRPADGKPDPLTVPFYHGADGNFYAHPVHREVTEIHAAAPEGEEYFRYSVDNDSPSQHSDEQSSSKSINPTTDTVYYIINSSDKYSSTAQPESTAVPQRDNVNKKPLGASSETSRNPRRRLPIRSQAQKNKTSQDVQNQSTETFSSTTTSTTTTTTNDHLTNKKPLFDSYEVINPHSTSAPSLDLISSFQPHPFTVSSVTQDDKTLKALEVHLPESSMPKPFTEQTQLEYNTKSPAKDTNVFAELTNVSVKSLRNNEGRQQVKSRQNFVTTSALPTTSVGTSTEYISLEQNINKSVHQRGKIQDSERTQNTQLKKQSFGAFGHDEKNSSLFQEATEVVPVLFQKGNQAFAYSERPTIQTSTVTENELLQSVYDIAHVMYKQPQLGLSPNNRPQTGILATFSHSDTTNSRKAYPSAVHGSSTLKPTDTQIPTYNITASSTNIHNQSRGYINVPEYQHNQPAVAFTQTKNSGSGYITSTNPTYPSRNNTSKSTQRRPTSSNLLVRQRVRRPHPTISSPSTSSIIPITHVSPNDINSIVNIQTTFKPSSPTSPSYNRATHTTSPRRQNRRPTKTTTSPTESFTDRNRSKLTDRPHSDERLLNRKPPAPTPETVNKGHYSVNAAISTVATRVEPSNPPVTYVQQQAPAPSPSVYNNSQRYEPSQYDPYYNLYDDEVELYKDVDYGQFSSSQQNDRQPTTQQQQQQQQQQQYRGQSPYKQVPQPPPQEQRNAAYAQPSYNTQQDVYSQNVDAQDYNENYNTAADDQGQYGQQAARQPIKTPARGSNTGRTRGGSYTTGTGVEQTVNRGTPASVSRSRPTLKPSTAIVSKAQEFVDIYKYPARRPDPVYPTPQVDKTAAKCRKDVCLLPDCNCGGKDIPGDFAAEEIPQLVLLTFDDSANDLNKGLYQDLFENGRTNPNGCPISATFYVSHEWTDYSHVQNLYATGHEIASHSISHSFGEQFSQKKWTREIAGQREILAAYGGVRMEDIRGMRAPFLAIGGNKMFKMLYDSNFTYDSSMPVYENRPPSWPYTLDYKIFHDCMIPPCPTRSYPGVWEVPMVMWQDLNGGRCSMGDACSNPPTADGVYKMLIKNFERHYTTNRAPFGLFYHAAWFTQPHHKEGFIAFLDTIVNMQDVWLVTNWQAIQWVRDPTPLSRIKNFPPFQCNYPERPRKCNNPKVCNLWHKSGVRYMRTCQPCPEVYPWTGKTGIRNSRVDNEIIEE